jgi:succinate dehydrogenase / fumarate reductase cytochrome b subunit
MANKLKYALYTGCTAKQSTPELLQSTLAVANKLGIELVDLEMASCCGASHLQDFDDHLSLVLNARNICYAEQLGLDIVTICNTCNLNLATVKLRLDSDEELKAKINKDLAEVGLEYKGTSEIKHFVYALKDDFGYDEIAKLVTKPLSDFNIAPYYGCHNIRPTEVTSMMDNPDDPYNPTSLDELIVALKGTAVEYDNKNSCCGFHAELQAPATANKLSGKVLLDAKDNNADMMVTPCPLCHLRMDTQRSAIQKQAQREVDMPVLHLAQMIGLALGIDANDLGFDNLVVKANFI